MAYTLTYKVHFTNEQSQEVVADIYRKNGAVPDDVAEYECVSLEISDKSEGQTKYDSTIIAREVLLSLWTKDSDEITWETFITAEHDEWKIIITVDGQPYFHGFITPDEGNAAFQDKPYEVRLSATNGLSLLKDIDLVDINGDPFDSDHTLMEYIAGALKQTGLELPIRTRCNYFNQQMANKGLGYENDMFAQAKLNYRTFQSSPTEFVSCYDALMIILDKFCRLEYWNGYWQIKNIAELQYIPNGFPDDFYVDYDANGANPVGYQETDNYAQVGKSVDIYPINEDQQIFSRFAIKSAKTIYNYIPWPEIPKNNKFQRGSSISGATGAVYKTDENGDDTTTQIGTYQDFTITDWTFGTFNGTPTPIAQLPALNAGVDSAWRRSSYNNYSVEINREILIDKSTTDTQVLQSEGLPVYLGDKVSIQFDFKMSFNFNNQLTIAAVHVYIIPTAGGHPYWWRDGAGITNRWRRNGAASEAINVEFVDSTDKTKIYKSVSLDSQPIPEDGVLYIQFLNVMDNNTPNQTYFRNFEFTYRPFVAGGYIQVKGDYWLRSQNKVFPDVAKEEVRISDSPKKMLQGALLFGSDLTEPTWYRNGLSETKKFKELLNIARFNHSYRRMYAIDGSFNGLNFASENNQLVKYPIGFHKRYRFVDMSTPRDFVLVPPLKLDLVKGWINASFVEVVNPSDSTTITPDGNYVVQKLIDEINATNAADWDSAGNAPAPGTPNFPPIAAVWTFVDRSIAIIMDSGSASPTYSASDGGAGNSPSITETYNVVVGDARWLIYQIGADVELDNVFTISIYGHNISYRAEEEIILSDGTQAGDSSSFNYIFQDNG